MNKELNLQIPDSLFSTLEVKAKDQGVSLEALCIFLLGKSDLANNHLVEPGLYPSLANGDIRNEMQKVMQSQLSREEIKKRVRHLETQIVRCIR
jgi:hypothetical protein